MFIERKEFEELKNRVEVLEFQRDNPNGLKIEFKYIDNVLCTQVLEYIKDGKLKEYRLPDCGFLKYWYVRENNVIEHSQGFLSDFKKYKFDTDAEVLIELQEPQKEENPTETKPSNVKKPKKVICVSENKHTGATLPVYIIKRYKQLKPFMGKWTSSDELAENLGTTYYNTMGYIKILNKYGLIEKRGTLKNREYKIKKLEDIK